MLGCDGLRHGGRLDPRTRFRYTYSVYQVEVWFSILSRKCLKRANFADALTATQHIEGFMTNYNVHIAHPFEWRKGVRFYRRLKDKIAARSELQLAA